MNQSTQTQIAKIVAVFNQKGGAGKSTTSMQVAGTAARRGFKTMVVDMDAQNTSSRHAAAAPDDNLFPANVINLAPQGGQMFREVRRYTTDYDLIIIDCPPAMESQIPRTAMLIADLALIPVIPSPADVWATEGAKLVVNEARVNRPDLEVRLIPNQVKNTGIARDVLAHLASDSDFPLTKSTLGSRTAYQECLLQGTTVHGLPQSSARQAVAEVEALTDEILEVLNLPKRKKGAKQ